MTRFAAPFVLSLLLAGCASGRALVAPPSDLADYRAFRVAAREGTRLSLARDYLERHPNGRFADEVRAAFEAEEPRFFERSQESREAVLGYLVDLPRGPHADAAVSLLVAFDTKLEERELDEIARKARLDEARLETAAVARRAVATSILAAVGALLEGSTYGVRLEEVGGPMRAVLTEEAPRTWGGAPKESERDLYFLLPTRPTAESRLLTLRVVLHDRDGIVRAAEVRGADLFVRWAEADSLAPLDPSRAEDRATAASHAMERLSGALERRFPSETCADRREGAELYRRSCGGWEVVVSTGRGAGDEDAILVTRGPPR